MDERGVNIDIVFRNGLKDYEVLPPTDVWDQVGPVIRKKQRPYLIFRAAALIATVISLGFLAYRWSQEISTASQELTQSRTEGSEILPPATGEVNQPVRKRQQVMLADASDPVNNAEMSQASGNNVMVTSVETPAVSDIRTRDEDQGGNLTLQFSKSNPSPGEVKSELYIPEIIPGNLPEPKTARWSVAALVSPSYHSRLSSGNNEALAGMMASEKPVVSYSGGVALSYRISRRLSVQSGLYYSNIGQELSGIVAYSGFLQHGNAKSGSNFDIVTANGTVKTTNGDVFLLDNFNGDRVITSYTSNLIDPEKLELNYVSSSLRQNFNYLEMPVVVRYKVIDKTLDLNIIGGVSSNLLVGNTVSAGDGTKLEVGETEGLNNITFSSSLGMGMEYNFNSKLSLNLEPTFRYYLNSFGSIPGLNIHPFSFGVFSGLSYKF